MATTYLEKAEKDKKIKPVIEWYFEYEGTEGFAPFYYAVLELAKSSGASNLKKVKEWYRSSELSPVWGQMNQSKQYQIEEAQRLLSGIGAVMKGIVAARSDRQKIDEFLEFYDKKKDPKSRETALRGVWLDLVDAKKGPGSVMNMMANLEFIMVRDYLVNPDIVSSEENIEKIDTTVRVKSVLKRKWAEYIAWKDKWEAELRLMKKIIDDRLKADKATINMYKNWSKPYIRNVKKLTMGESDWAVDERNPYIPMTVNSLCSNVVVAGWSGKPDLPNYEYGPFVPFVIFDMMEATIPGANYSSFTLKIKAYVLEKQDWQMELESWKEIDLETDNYLKEILSPVEWEEIKKEEAPKKVPLLDKWFKPDQITKNYSDSSPLFSSLFGIKPAGAKEKKSGGKPEGEPFLRRMLFSRERKQQYDLAEEKAKKIAWVVYNILKAKNGLLTSGPVFET